jgi:hypothetical protein
MPGVQSISSQIVIFFSFNWNIFIDIIEMHKMILTGLKGTGEVNESPDDEKPRCGKRATILLIRAL